MSQNMIILFAWNLIVMLLFGLDKLFAKMHSRRISEFSLLLCTFLLGGMGALLGMVLFNHKTSKPKFRYLVPLATVVGIVAVYFYGIDIPAVFNV